MSKPQRKPFNERLLEVIDEALPAIRLQLRKIAIDGFNAANPDAAKDEEFQAQMRSDSMDPATAAGSALDIEATVLAFRGRSLWRYRTFTRASTRLRRPAQMKKLDRYEVGDGGAGWLTRDGNWCDADDVEELETKLAQAMAWVPEGAHSCSECGSLCPPLHVYRPCEKCTEPLCGTCGYYVGGVGNCCTKCHGQGDAG